jgi:hypothetical protein
VIVRQRNVEEPPFTNCRVCDAVRMLIQAGVRVPDWARLVAAIRRATGVPEIGPDGAQGTTAADLIAAFARLFPWIPIEARLWDDAELLDAIAAGQLAASVSVKSYNSLPGNLDRWSPRFDGGHQCGLADARPDPADPKVLWVDPLGLGRYRGEWVRWSRVKPHLSQAGGRVFATTIPIGAAMSTSVVLSRVLPAGSVVVLHKGVATFRYDDEALTFVEDKPTTRNLKPLADTVVTVDQQPRGKGRPIGRFVRVAAGGLEGRYVRLRDIEIREPVPGDPVDVDAIVAAAVAQARLETEAEVRGEYSLVDEPLFRQAVPA